MHKVYKMYKRLELFIIRSVATFDVSTLFLLRY